MRKIINRPDDFVDEILDGIVAAHPGEFRLDLSDPRVLTRATPPRPGKVGIVTGGGSGHLPLFLGYVGAGLLDAAAVGNVFSSPSTETVLAATRAADGGAGVLYLYGNYGGDVLNFEAAAAAAANEGVPTMTVLGTDDVMSAPATDRGSRRGVAGIVLAFKAAGAAAESGATLAQVAAVARRAVEATRTAGVGLAPTILPTAGEPTFTLADGEMEIGIGIHGEPGVARRPIETADRIAETLVDAILADLPSVAGRRVAILVNGLGATPLEELYVVYRHVSRRLIEADAVPALAFVGEYATSLEMAGASVSMMLLDDELESLLIAPAVSPFFRPGTTAATRVPSMPVGSTAPELQEVARGSFVSPLRWILSALAERLPDSTDELRMLDAALGDGDLGVTVRSGALAVGDLIDALPDDIAQRDLLQRAGAAFERANPSTFASLVGRAVVEAAEEVDDTAPMDRPAAIAFGRRVADAVAALGGAQLGDKTLLDVLTPALDLLEADPSADLDDWLEQRIAETSLWTSRRGRASWHGAQSAGLADPGSVAIARILSVIAVSD